MTEKCGCPEFESPAAHQAKYEMVHRASLALNGSYMKARKQYEKANISQSSYQGTLKYDRLYQKVMLREAVRMRYR